MISYFLTSGDGRGWAIDEDARLIRRALTGTARERNLANADVVHSPFWAALAMHSPGVLAKKFVIAHADNPPFFYLTQPDFAWAMQAVNLWVARSHEAKAQFDALALPSVHIPYAIDENLFFPIPDRTALRRRLGVPESCYIIGNFHRDSEGADLFAPKFQKAPEMLVRIAAGLVSAGAPIHLLLAGPRRHWILRELRREQIPFTYAGEEPGPGDDLARNILPREQLNELYNACDIYVIPSRWEGGPQSAMEAAASRCKVLGIPLGVGRDILEPASLFSTVEGAVETILDDIRRNTLGPTVEPQFERWKKHHTSIAMGHSIQSLYSRLEVEHRPNPVGFTATELAHAVIRRLPRGRGPLSVSIIHEGGASPYIDNAIDFCRENFGGSGQGLPVIAGTVKDPGKLKGQVFAQITGPDTTPDELVPGAVILAPSAQDAVNLRTAGCRQPVVVCPLIFEPGKNTDTAPFLVSEGDTKASTAVWQAMLDGRPVVYPANSPYYFQVFHGGIAGNRSEDASAVRSAESIRALARPPRREAAKAFLETLLTGSCARRISETFRFAGAPLPGRLKEDSPVLQDKNPALKGIHL